MLGWLVENFISFACFFFPFKQGSVYRLLTCLLVSLRSAELCYVFRARLKGFPVTELARCSIECEEMAAMGY